MEKELDRKFVSQDKKIAIIIDNYPAHPKVDDLKALALILLRPNTTLKTQPMRQSAIRTLKEYYHYTLIKRYITSTDGGRSSTCNMLEVMTLLTAA